MKYKHWVQTAFAITIFSFVTTALSQQIFQDQFEATSLKGRLLDTNDFTDVPSKETPVVGATVSILNTNLSVRSDNNGALWYFPCLVMS